MHHRSVFLALAALLLAGIMSPSAKAEFVVSFEPPGYAGSTATLGVMFTFSGDPGDSLEAFQLSVVGSDPLLTMGGTDYGRFSFTSNEALLPGWGGTPGEFGSDGYVFYSTFGGGLAPTATPFLLGTLSIDLSGLDARTPLTVTLNGQDPLFPTAAAGTVGGAFDFIPVDAGSATVQLTAVPEPSSLALCGLGGGGLLVAGLRRRKSPSRKSARSLDGTAGAGGVLPDELWTVRGPTP